MNTPSIILLTVIVTTCVLGLFLLIWKFDKTIRNLNERVKKLEKAGPPRLPHKSQEDLMHAIAMFDADLDAAEIELERKRVIKAHMLNAMATGTKREVAP